MRVTLLRSGILFPGHIGDWLIHIGSTGCFCGGRSFELTNGNSNEGLAGSCETRAFEVRYGAVINAC